VSKTDLVVIDAGTLFTPEKKFSPARLLIEGSSIAAVGPPESISLPAEAERVDALQFVVTPGFIDPHIHGCGGVDLMEGTYEALNAVSRLLVRHGTTSFLPTTVSSPPDVLTQVVEQLGASMSHSVDGAEPLGIHLEGPFISVAKRGTHKEPHLHLPSLDLLERWIQRSGHTLKLLTVAPELDGIEPVTLMARHYGITVAMGHSNATFEQAQAAASRGICYAVHTFNAMRGLSHRDPGIVGEVLVDDRVFAEIIADGIHVDRSVVRIFSRAKSIGRVLLVTDAISATDMPDGSYRLSGDMIEVVRGVCRDSEGRLAGSTLTQEVAFRNFVEWTGWKFEEALLGLTRNPATALNLERKGVLEPGADADVVILDDNFRVIKTFVAGRIVFQRD
jgi:N-acetylglucosamine-6-phosphate deacetylase